jgi:hypothetical protein
MKPDLTYDAAVVAGYLSAWLTATVATVPDERRADVQSLVDRLEAAIAASMKEPADG